jgi:hypothetical protein
LSEFEEAWGADAAEDPDAAAVDFAEGDADLGGLDEAGDAVFEEFSGFCEGEAPDLLAFEEVEGDAAVWADEGGLGAFGAAEEFDVDDVAWAETEFGGIRCEEGRVEGVVEGRFDDVG